MITFLEIENILLIKRTAIEFTKGLCVLTGETGAGKSIILNSILFLLGKKIKTDAKSLVREAAEKGSISGCFDITKNSALKSFLNEKGFEAGDELIIKRVVSKTEKERSFINGNVVSGALLSEIGNFLIEVNRQNEQIGLLETSAHLKILDLYAGAGSELSLVENSYKELLKIRNEIKETENYLEKFKNEKDYLESLVAEIEGLELEENEEQVLSDKKIEISKALKDSQSVNEVIQKLFYEKNVRSSFVSASKALSSKGMETNQFELTLERILNEIDLLEEALVSYIKDKNYTEYDLDKINERLFLIRDIARKYKVKPEELTMFLANQKEILNKINFSDETLNALKQKESEALGKYKNHASILSAKRKVAGAKLEEQINSEFADLEMKGADFKVFFKEDEVLKEAGTGMDNPQFLVSTNIGSKHAPLAKVASGGELSRLLLAIKIALLKVNNFETIIFDEIDAGIGGKTAIAIASKLKELSKEVQVILITHQAQIAARTDLHLKIQKTLQDTLVETSVKMLKTEEKEEEIARMLSGEISKESLENAKRMIYFNS